MEIMDTTKKHAGKLQFSIVFSCNRGQWLLITGVSPTMFAGDISWDVAGKTASDLSLEWSIA